MPDREANLHPNPLVGELVDWATRPVAGNSSYPDRDVDVATIRDLAGQEWSVWGLSKVLSQEFAALRRRDGESLGALLAINYAGKSEEPGKPAYHRYRVVVDHTTVSAEQRPAAHAAAAASAAPDPALVPFAGGPEPTEPREAELECEECHWKAGHHAPGCPQDIPF